MSGIVHPYRSILVLKPDNITPIRIPVLPNPRILMRPEGYETQDAISNTAYEVNFVAGLEIPVIEFNAAVCSTWFNAANLNAFFVTLTGAVGVEDLAVIPDGGIAFWDGVAGLKASSVKGCSVDLMVQGKGAWVNCRMRFMGLDIAAYADPSAALLDTFRENPARSQHVNFTGLTSPLSWSFSGDNGCTPNPEMGDTANLVTATGGVKPTEINFGRLTGRLSCSLQSNASPPSDGTSVAAVITPPSGSAMTLTCPNPIWQGRDARGMSPSNRQSRDFSAICRGGATGQAPFSFA